MRITMYELGAPICYCGGKMEIYVFLSEQTLRVKCLDCGLEQNMFIPFDASSMTLRSVYHSAHSMME